MLAQEVAAGPVQLGDAPSAYDAVRHAGAEEVGPGAAEAAGHAHDPYGLLDLLPSAAIDAHAVGQMQPIRFGAQNDPGAPLAVLVPLPAALMTRPQAAPCCSRLTLIDRQDSTVSRLHPAERPEPRPPIIRLRFSRNRLETPPPAAPSAKATPSRRQSITLRHERQAASGSKGNTGSSRELDGPHGPGGGPAKAAPALVRFRVEPHLSKARVVSIEANERHHFVGKSRTSSGCSRRSTP